MKRVKEFFRKFSGRETKGQLGNRKVNKISSQKTKESAFFEKIEDGMEAQRKKNQRNLARYESGTVK